MRLSAFGLFALAAASAAFVACDPSSDEHHEDPTTSSDDIVVADLDRIEGDGVVSPDGSTLVFVRRVDPHVVEVVRADLDASPIATKVVKSFRGYSVRVQASPTGKYFTIVDTARHRVAVYPWDLSREEKIVYADFAVWTPGDTWAAGYSSMRTYVDETFVVKVSANAVEIEGSGTAKGEGTFDDPYASRFESVTFSPSGKELLFHRWNDVFAFDVSTGSFSTVFADVSFAEPVLSTYDGDSVLLATEEPNTKWGPHRLVMLKRDGTSTEITEEGTVFAQGSTHTGPEGLRGKRTPPHCILSHEDSVFVVTKNASDELALAKWTRASGLATVHAPLATRPERMQTTACRAAMSGDGSHFSYQGVRPSDGAMGFTTVTIPATAGAPAERFVPIAGGASKGFEFLARGMIGASGDARLSMGESGDIHFVDLRQGTPVATTQAERWWYTPVLPNGDLVTLEEAGKAIYRTNAGTHALLYRTTSTAGVLPEDGISRVLHASEHRAVLRVSRGLRVVTY